MPTQVTMRVIPIERMRYPTVGDWQFTKRGQLRITVAKMSDRRYETLIGVHELIEALLCREADVDQIAVDQFDIAYEQARKPGDDREPGDDPTAPYHQQHLAATWFERRLADVLGVDWDAYAREVEEK